MALPTDAKARKDIPIYSGFVAYFPRAIAAVAQLSKIGNDQHNPGKPLHWDRSKSQDEKDALMRHLVDDAQGVPVDTDGVMHATKLAWRAMANLEKALEAAEKAAEVAKPTPAVIDIDGRYSKDAPGFVADALERGAKVEIAFRGFDDGEEPHFGLLPCVGSANILRWDSHGKRKSAGDIVAVRITEKAAA